MLPYRTDEDYIAGVVITFTDVTEMKQAADQVRAARDYAERIVETLHEPLLVLAADLRVCSANLAFYEEFQLAPAETQGHLLYDLAGGCWDIPALRGLLEGMLSKHTEVRDFQLAHDFAHLGWRTMRLNARAIHRADQRPERILLAIEDVTDRLEREAAALALREQERLGRELHDTLGQQATGISMLAASLHERLTGDSSPQAELAGKLLDCIERSKEDLRAMARGLLPVQVDAEGLMIALADLVEQTQEVHGLACRFECDDPVAVQDNFTAMHLYRVAQEAVHNAVKHAQASQIVVSLAGGAGRLTLQVRDDGVGIGNQLHETEGNGIRIMRYRCHVIGGTLSMEPNVPGGTVVRCSVREKEREDG